MNASFLDFFRKDRREFKRFIVNEVIPVFPDESAPSNARILDLSVGGIAMLYPDSGNPLDDPFDLDIRASDGFRLGPVQMEKLSEAASGKEADTRKVRARFINLSKVQELKLQSFLSGYEKRFSRQA